MVDVERELNAFFEVREIAERNAANLAERLRRDGEAFTQVVRGVFESASDGFKAHGRTCHVMEGPRREGYPSVEIHIDHNGKRELTYSLGSVPMNRGQALGVTESGMVLVGDADFRDACVNDITVEQVSARLLAVYKDAYMAQHPQMG